MEVYPSLAEGIGLENRQGMKVPRGFESLIPRHLIKNSAEKETQKTSRDGAVWQLVGLITRRSLVQIQLPQPIEWKSLNGFHFCCSLHLKHFDYFPAMLYFNDHFDFYGYFDFFLKTCLNRDFFGRKFLKLGKIKLDENGLYLEQYRGKILPLKYSQCLKLTLV